MLQFGSDYMECACDEILLRIAAENRIKRTGYGTDEICQMAKQKIKNECNAQDAEIFFLVGGTQTNAVVLDALLGKCGGVISATTGHISVHEAGAIEATGHKVLCVESLPNGKIKAESVEKMMAEFCADDTFEHMVQPEVVYISHPTENGAVYTKAELEALRDVCNKYNLRLFADGARLGYALAAKGTDVTLQTLASLCDAFYIGGTKVGALFGEAVVFSKKEFAKGFFTLVKRRGALLAKGFLLGLQFDELFTNGLYYKLGQNAVNQADFLRCELKKKGYSLFCENPTNQVFVTLECKAYKRISEKANVQIWEKQGDDKIVVRIATSWATTKEEIEELLSLF